MEDGQSLHSLYEDAERKKRIINDNQDRNSPEYQNMLLTAVQLYSDALSLSEDLSLFSLNEQIDDISTTNLKYLLLNFHLAELFQQLRNDDRKAQLLKSRKLYERFLKRLDTYEILNPSDAKVLEAYEESPDTFSVTGHITDPATRRQSTIARYKLSKDLQRKLEHLRSQAFINYDDDSVARELHLTHLAICTHEAFQALQSTAQELRILALAPTADPRKSEKGTGQRGEEGDDQAGYSEKLDFTRPNTLRGMHSGPLLDKSGKPLRPFTLLDKRQRLQEGVFRPDHNLPTMSIDEYLEEERRRGGIIDGGGDKSGVRPEIDEDDMAQVDEETMKDRRWDDFKDNNPKGVGNTLNRG